MPSEPTPPFASRAPSAPAQDLPPELAAFVTALTDRYVLEREIGRGGMATVYLARDVKHDRQVALKVLNPELGAVLGVERFLAEIRVTANLQHPHLLPLFDSGEAAGLLFYVMPYVDGESLRARLERERQLPVDDTVRIAAAIAGALDYAHAHGVIHRDLKPENILLQAGQPVVADFGIALAVSRAGGARVTQTGLSLGTPQYMSPEQATGDRVIDGRSDIYSLGAVTYEMLAGEPPHAASTSQAIIARLMTETPRSLSAMRPSVPTASDAAVQRALEKLPADRFVTATQFAEALRDGTIHRPIASLGPSAAPARRVPPPLVLVGVAASFVAVGALIFALGVAMRRTVAPPDVQLVKQLTFEGTITFAALSPDGKWLAYVTRDCGTFQRCDAHLQVREISGTQSVAIVTSPTVKDVEWTHDGASILFVGRPDSTASPGIYLVPRLGGAARRIADGNTFALSPDDRTLLRARGDDSSAALVRYDVATGTAAESVNVKHGIGALRYSPDGRRLVSAYFGEATILFTPAGRILDSIAVGATSAVEWEPSGEAVDALVVNVLGAVGSADLVRIPIRSDRFVRDQITVRLGQVAGSQGRFNLAADGRVALIAAPTTWELRKIDTKEAHARWETILERGAYFNLDDISPDGTALSLTAVDNLGENLYAYPVAGGSMRAITGAQGRRLFAQWSPDGRHLFYYRLTPPPAGLVVSEPGTAQERTLGETLEFQKWIGNGAIANAEADSAKGAWRFAVLDTMGHAVWSMRLPDSLSLDASRLPAADPRRNQWAYWSPASHNLVVVDVQSRAIATVRHSAAPLWPVRWGDDGALYALAPDDLTGKREPNALRRVVRLDRSTAPPTTVAQLPGECDNVVMDGSATHIYCSVIRSRPDVWLAAPGVAWKR